MVKITAEQIDSIIKDDRGRLVVPDQVTMAFRESITFNEEFVKASEELGGKYDRAKEERVNVTLDSDPRVDAFLHRYAPRSFLVPRIAIRDLARHRAFQQLPDRLNVLDIGCGPGSVILGLAELFSNNSLRSVGLRIWGLDQSRLAFKRIQLLSKRVPFPPDCKVRLYPIDLSQGSERSILATHLDSYGLFDLIFGVNFFPELSQENAIIVFKWAIQYLSPNGVLVVANSPYAEATKLAPVLRKHAIQKGLNIYYPCPSKNRCSGDSKSQCWAWRDFLSAGNDGDTIGSQLDLDDDRGRVPWQIHYFTRSKATVYDYLKSSETLNWGVFAGYTDNTTKRNCRVCRIHEKVWVKSTKTQVERGSLVGGWGPPDDSTIDLPPIDMR